MVESILVYFIGLYVGALILTGAFTRLLNLLLRRTIENPTRSVLVCILTALLFLLIASHTMGWLDALVYISSVVLWLAFDLYRFTGRNVHIAPRPSERVLRCVDSAGRI